MERVVADVMKANYRHCEVTHVGGPGDRGIDVILVDDSQERRLVQVKRRGSQHAVEGFATLQSILGTLALEGARHGVVVTTADHFSYQAVKERGRAEDQGFVVEFVDRGILDRLLGPLLPEKPWRHLFQHTALSYVDAEVRAHFSEMMNAGR